MNEENGNDLVELTAEIVSAYASNNHFSPTELPDLIKRVHAALASVEAEGESEAEEGSLESAPEEPRAPAVPVNASVSDEAITCLECGKSFKTLKRHLMTEHGLDPESYRQRWHLSKDYPLVAPSYSRRRSQTAKAIGLGQKGGRKSQ
ncbi:MAG: transcriptional regulator [Alphaproteobacteria bacterium]|nr:MAG: transcriptional regulator [Alphaproteobacteria bacterium]